MPLGMGWVVVGVDAVEEVLEFASSELPVEGSGDGVVPGLERGQPFADLIEVGEVVGGYDLALDDGEVDLGLVQPGSVHG